MNQENHPYIPKGSVWVHKKGSIYTIIGHVMIESTWREGVIYRDSRGVDIVRDSAEFLDGRFRRLK